MNTTYLKVLVVETITEDNTTIAISYNREKQTVKDVTMILASAIASLIKVANKTDVGVKDYELINMVNTYLQHEFVSTDSFGVVIKK